MTYREQYQGFADDEATGPEHSRTNQSKPETEARPKGNGHAGTEAPASPFPFWRVADMRQLRPPTFIVDRLIPDNSLVLIFAPSGHYKTMTAVDLVLALAYRRDFHGLAVQTAEATAEYVHRHIRRELNIVPGRGKRYSWGYPAIPDLDDHQKVFALLPAEKELGMTLSPAYQLIPEQSTAAIIVHHPEAKYYAVGGSRVEQLEREMAKGGG